MSDERKTSGGEGARPGESGSTPGAAGAVAGEPPRRRRWRRWLGVAGVLAAIGAVGACHHAGGHDGGWHRHGWHGGSGLDPQTAAKRVDRGLERVLSMVDASDAQKSRARDIAHAALQDLGGHRDAHRAARARAIELLAAPVIDRNAIETLRAETLARADQVSRRVVAAPADLAEVLTPEQRARLGSRVESRLGRRGA